MRIPGPERECALVHPLRERFDAAGTIARQATRDIVWTFYKQRAQEIDPLISVAGFDVQFHWLGQSIDLLHGHRPVQVAAFGDDQSREQLRRARWRSDLVRILFVENFAAMNVDHDDRT